MSSAAANAPYNLGELVDTLAGQRLRVRYDPEHRTAEAFDTNGRALPGVMAFWFAWVAFHPDTEVLRASEATRGAAPPGAR